MISCSVFSIARMRNVSWRFFPSDSRSWLDAAPREDAAAGVRTLGAPEQPRGATAGDLRLPRLHTCVCAQPTGAVHDSRSDDSHTPSAECEGGGGVVPAASARPGRESGRGAQCQTPGPLPVLRAADEI